MTRDDIVEFWHHGWMKVSLFESVNVAWLSILLAERPISTSNFPASAIQR